MIETVTGKIGLKVFMLVVGKRITAMDFCKLFYNLLYSTVLVSSGFTVEFLIIEVSLR